MSFYEMIKYQHYQIIIKLTLMNHEDHFTSFHDSEHANQMIDNILILDAKSETSIEIKDIDQKIATIFLLEL